MRAAFRCGIVLLVALSAMAPAREALGAGVDRAAFAAPPKQFGPYVRWWWPGGDVENAELDRQLQVLRDAGFAGAEIQSFAVGLPPDVSPRVFTFGTDDWFDSVAFTLDRAQEYGLEIDLTFGSAWPSGGDAIEPEHQLQQLVLSVQAVTGPAPIDRMPAPPKKPAFYTVGKGLLGLDPQFDPAQMEVVHVLAARAAGDQTQEGPPAQSVFPGFPNLPDTFYLDAASVVDLRPFVAEDGRIVWDVPAGNWLLFAVWAGPTGTQPFYSAEPNRGHVLDHFSAAATARHIESFGEVARARFGSHFGTTLRSIFTESLELRSELLWTPALFAEFETRRGYSLLPYLPALFVPFRYDIYLQKAYPTANPSFDVRALGRRVREDYERTLTELMAEKFFDPLLQWSETHGLLSRVEAYGGPFDVLTLFGHSHVPETETLYAGGRRSFLKLASSAAHVFGKPIVSSELGAFKDKTYMISPQLLRAEVNRELAAGVNQVVLHGFPYRYQTPAFLHVGWFPFSSIYLPKWQVIGSYSTVLSDQTPFWRFMPALTSYIARAQLILQSGTSVSELAILGDTVGVPNDRAPDPPLMRAIELLGYTYDLVNEDVLRERSEVGEDGLRIGDQVFRALLVHDMETMSAEVAAKLVELAAAGVPVVFVASLPRRAPGLADFPSADQAVLGSLEQLFAATPEAVETAGVFRNGPALFLAEPLHAPLWLLLALGVEPGLQPGVGAEQLCYAHRRIADADYYFVTNSSDRRVAAPLYFADDGRDPEEWDLSNGQVTAARYRSVEERLAVQVDLPPGAATVIGFERSVASAADSVTVDSVPVESWSLTAQASDFIGAPTTIERGPEPLADWRTIPELTHFSGTGTYLATVDLPASFFAAESRLSLDLGEVFDVAEVVINGVPVATLPARPYTVDVTSFLVPGANSIEVVVTTTLRNLFVGFAKQGLEYYYPLLLAPALSPTGLVGPVRVVRSMLVAAPAAPASGRRAGPMVASAPVAQRTNPAARLSRPGLASPRRQSPHGASIAGSPRRAGLPASR